MEAFTAAVVAAGITAPASDAELTFLCDYMSVGQQYSQYFASAEGRSRIATGGPAQAKHVADTLQKAASSQVFPVVQIFCLGSVMEKEALVQVLCSPALANALWASVAGCCQYLHQQQQQQRVASSNATSSSGSSSRVRGSREHGRTNAKGKSSSSGREEGWLELEIPPDHQLLPVPGGQLAVTTQAKFVAKEREWRMTESAELVAEQGMKWPLFLMRDVILTWLVHGGALDDGKASEQPSQLGTNLPSSRSSLDGSDNGASSSSSYGAAIKAAHLQLLLESVVLTAAEGERAGRSENFLQSLNIFLVATRVASKEEREAFLAARGKLLLQVLLLVGKAVDKGEMKDLRMAVAYALGNCMAEGGPSDELEKGKCCWGWKMVVYEHSINVFNSA